MTTPVAPAARRRMSVSEGSIPILARGAKLRFDESRGRWVLLVPERVMAPDEIAVEILQLCDGERTVAAIIDLLVEKYTAPREEIAADVIAMLQDLAESGFLVEAKS
ncbi:Coenzyme PQQ synthesis protein D [Devosia sp. DBB001]|nr:Coenzyme PQQ synthesis protein D [Devosia sp. DBB001]